MNELLSSTRDGPDQSGSQSSFTPSELSSIYETLPQPIHHDGSPMLHQNIRPARNAARSASPARARVPLHISSNASPRTVSTLGSTVNSSDFSSQGLPYSNRSGSQRMPLVNQSMPGMRPRIQQNFQNISLPMHLKAASPRYLPPRTHAAQNLQSGNLSQPFSAASASFSSSMKTNNSNISRGNVSILKRGGGFGGYQKVNQPVSRTAHMRDPNHHEYNKAFDDCMKTRLKPYEKHIAKIFKWREEMFKRVVEKYQQIIRSNQDNHMTELCFDMDIGAIDQKADRLYNEGLTLLEDDLTRLERECLELIETAPGDANKTVVHPVLDNYVIEPFHPRGAGSDYPPLHYSDFLEKNMNAPSRYQPPPGTPQFQSMPIGTPSSRYTGSPQTQDSIEVDQQVDGDVVVTNTSITAGGGNNVSRVEVVEEYGPQGDISNVSRTTYHETSSPAAINPAVGTVRSPNRMVSPLVHPPRFSPPQREEIPIPHRATHSPRRVEIVEHIEHRPDGDVTSTSVRQLAGDDGATEEEIAAYGPMCGCVNYGNPLVPSGDRGLCKCICKQIVPHPDELLEIEVAEMDELDRILHRWHTRRRAIICRLVREGQAASR